MSSSYPTAYVQLVSGDFFGLGAIRRLEIDDRQLIGIRGPMRSMRPSTVILGAT